MSDAPQPPKPPEMQRRMQFYPIQLIGMPFIFLIPVLAILGVFDTGTKTVETSNSSLEMLVEYPRSCRYKNVVLLEVFVTNTSSEAIPTVTVSYDREYFESFSETAFMPSEETVTQDAYEIELQDLKAGDTQYIQTHLRCEAYGQHELRIEAAASETEEPATITGSTIIFP